MAGEIQTTTVISQVLPALHSDSTADLTWWSLADLIDYMDEACKRMARLTMFDVERDTSITAANGTPTYPLASRIITTLHVSFGSTPLRPAGMIEMESRDPNFQTDTGIPDHWYEQHLGMLTIGLAPVPNTGATVSVIATMFPPVLDTAQSNTLVQAPAPMAGYLTFAILAGAYGREGESEMPDVAQHCRARMQFYEEIFAQYFGRGSVASK